jgi:hypothetical protein
MNIAKDSMAHDRGRNEREARRSRSQNLAHKKSAAPEWEAALL